MVSCYRGLLYFVVRASLPLVAGLLCYHGLVLWCVGLQLCHWSLRSARAWVLGAAPGLCPRWVTRYARGAWGCVRCSTGRFGQRDSSSAGARRSVWRATRRQLFVGIRVLSIADGSSFGVRHVSPDRFAQRSGPRCGWAMSSFVWHTVRACTAPRRVAVELKRSRHDSASISKVLKSCCGPRVEGSSTGGGTELQQETASTVLPREAR